MEPDATVSVGLVERDRAVLEELHERRLAHIEQIRRLLGGEDEVLGGDVHGLALSHDLDRVPENAVHLQGERHLFAVHVDEEAGLPAAVEEARQLEHRAEVLWREDEVVLPILLGGVGHPERVARFERIESLQVRRSLQSGR